MKTQKNLPECINQALRSGKKAFKRGVRTIHEERKASPPKDVVEAFSTPTYYTWSKEQFEICLEEAAQIVCGHDGISGTAAAAIQGATTPEELVHVIVELNNKNLRSDNPLVKGIGGLGRTYLHSVVNSLMSQNEDVKRAYNKRMVAIRAAVLQA